MSEAREERMREVREERMSEVREERMSEAREDRMSESVSHLRRQSHPLPKVYLNFQLWSQEMKCLDQR
jgi:hypothetical protein